jgi:hypothetical protein
MEAVEKARPPNSVLGSPARCWCDSVQRVTGDEARRYVRMHLISGSGNPAPGVYLFTCPDRNGAYVGIDGGVVPQQPYPQLLSVNATTVTAADRDASTGLYL